VQTRYAQVVRNDEDAIRFAPDQYPPPPLVDDNPQSYPEVTLLQHLDALVTRTWREAVSAALTPKLVGPLRHLWDRRAVVQIEVTFPSTKRCWHVGAWHPELQVVSGEHADPDYRFCYIASQVYALVRGEPITTPRAAAYRRPGPPAPGRLTPLDPFRLHDTDEYLVVDDDPVWHPLRILWAG
jgi:hypothetical protein